MPINAHRFVALLGLTLAGCSLSGCGTINEKMAGGMADIIPAWAGGLPADAPPRPGTAKYDEFMRERERNRQTPAAERSDNGGKPAQTSQDAVH